LPAVLYRCGTSSLTSKEVDRLNVFENRALKTIFGPKRDETIGGWREVHKEELHNLHFSTNIIGMVKSRRIR
jgi:hypothetical protein